MTGRETVRHWLDSRTHQ